jgi:2-polyprenyl-3-methyl-5-hydroxy-6-metoxy-1,4-benzoquinol methylase
LDTVATDAFAERLVGVVNDAALSFMLSIGHRTGLFDSMATLPPATSEQIAQAAKLNERYVREWLGAMVVGKIIEYNAAERTYALPAAHAALLTRAAVPNNMAATMQWFAVLGGVEDKIVDCFHRGGGVHYSAFSRFHEVMAGESDQTTVAGLVEHILPLVPGLVDKLNAGIDVLDVGCGAGRAMNYLAGLFPNSRFTGYDFSEEAIARGRAEAESRGLDNVTFEVRDVAQINERSKFDVITAFDAIHDQRDPASVLSQIEEALRDGGTFLMQDIRASSHVENNMELPLATLLYTISTMHCMTVSLALGGAGLGTAWGEELARQMLAEAGFRSVATQQLPHDILNTYYIVRKSA